MLDGYSIHVLAIFCASGLAYPHLLGGGWERDDWFDIPRSRRQSSWQTSQSKSFNSAWVGFIHQQTGLQPHIACMYSMFRTAYMTPRAWTKMFLLPPHVWRGPSPYAWTTEYIYIVAYASRTGCTPKSESPPPCSATRHFAWIHRLSIFAFGDGIQIPH